MNKMLTLTTTLMFASNGCKKRETPVPPVNEPGQADVAKPIDRTAAQGRDTKLAALAGRYELDASHSAVMFRIGHMNVSHTLGRFNEVDGSIVLDADLAKSSVDIRVDAASVFTADKKRDDHLRSPDFLNVAQFPTIRFTSSSVRASASGYEVTGELELHGVRNSVTARFELVGSGRSMLDDKIFLIGFTGDLDLKRSDFGMTNMQGPVGDDVRLTIAVEAARK